MQDPLKERLTGAAILVVVVVLAVPEMFRGRPGRAPLPATPAVSSAEPLRTYRLPDAAGASAQAAEPASPPAAGADAVPPATSGPGQAQATAPPAPGRVVSAPAVAASAPATSPAPATVPARSTLQAPAQAAAPQQPEPAVAASAAPRPGKAPASQGGWAVQVGSFRVRELAERMAREVRAKGFKVHVVGPDDRGLIRVRSALQSDKAAALVLKQQMVARGLKPIVNASP